MTALHSINPATNEIVWQGLAATSAQVDAAVRDARRAFESWADLTVEQRIPFLESFADHLKDRLETLADAISRETGKPHWEAISEVNAMIQKIPLSIEAYYVRCTERIREQGAALSLTRHKPHGVLAVFGPFNFPGHLPNGHIVPALLAGNAIVFKPSEYAPLTAEITKQCWEAAGLPDGVLTLVQGGRDTGAWLAAHPGLDGLLFTGSWSTGHLFSEQWASQPGKLLALEMGGNNPLVVTAVNDLPAAAYLIIQSAYLTAGQRCSCARRLIVLDAVAEPLLRELKAMLALVKVGPFTERPEPFMGPVISHATAQRLLESQATLLRQGGKPLVEMKQLTPNTGLLSPGLMDMTAVQNRPDEEIFGPFLQVIRVPDFASAIQEANRTTYGLTAGLLSNERREYEEFYRRVRAGVINWNTALTGASSAAPFGGIGRSGNHRPSAFYAADYCSYPVASMELNEVKMPQHKVPGMDGMD